MAISFEHSSPRNTTAISHNERPAARFGHYIYRHWLRMYNDRPPFQRHHFLAKPFRFVEEGNYTKPTRRVTDIPFALKFHQSLCNSIAARENDIIFGAEAQKSFKDSGYRLAHLFRSLFMVIDYHEDNNSPEKEDMWKCRDYMIQPASGDDDWESERRRRYADWHKSRYSVLLVRTGDDAHLSEPISFQPLFEGGLALPPIREDCSPEKVVRVRLDTAMEFVEGLIRREEEALPHVRQVAEDFENELDDKCQEWMEKVLKHAGEVGLDKNGFT